MTTRTVSVGLNVPTAHYLALERIADKRGVQVHTLIEGLVGRALTGAPTEPPQRKPRSRVRIDPDEFLRLYSEKLTDRQIADRLGANRDTIANVRFRLGLPPNGRPRAAFDEAELRRLHAEKLTDVEISARMGLSKSTIGNHRNRLGLPKNVNGGRPRAHYRRDLHPAG